MLGPDVSAVLTYGVGGGMKGELCQESNFPPPPQIVKTGIKVASSDRNVRCCDLVRLKTAELVNADRVCERASAIQSKTSRPVQFELTEDTRKSALNWMFMPEMIGCDFMLPSRFHEGPHISTRQFEPLVRDLVTAIGLEPSGHGTHSMRRTMAAEIYQH
jgi:hypothetical protein